jgi:nucleotide-binding universal stress UspA family protein
MFKRLLLPLDLTAKHTQAVATAVELAAQSAGSVILLHVIELIPGLSRQEDPAFYGRLVEMAQTHLDNIGPAFAERQIPCQALIAFGNRVEETVRCATQNHCDLIVMTAPVFDAANPAVGWGSLSFKISVLAPTPVLLVKSAGSEQIKQGDS